MLGAYTDRIKTAMLKLEDVLGKEDYGNLQKLIRHVDENFNQLIFEDDISSDQLDAVHGVAQSFSLMMELLAHSNELH